MKRPGAGPWRTLLFALAPASAETGRTPYHVKRRTWRWLVLGAIALAFPAHAIVLFRADTRHPNIVFEQGFVAPGANTDPLLHLTGATCLNANGAAELTSAYISMTERASDVARFATYVYNIVPDADAPSETRTYDVSRGLRNLQNTAGVHRLNLVHRDEIATLLAQPMVNGQHMALRVAPESIASVDVYEYDTARHAAVLVRTDRNPRFRAPVSSESRFTFSGDMISGIRSGGRPTQIRAVVSANGTEHAVCLLPSAACFDRPQHPMTVQATGLFPHPATCVVRPALPPGGLFQQALQIILD